MKTLRTPTLLLLLAAMTLVATACDSGDGVELTTTSSVVGSTSEPAPDVTTSTVDGGSTTSTTLAGQTVEDSEIVGRESTDQGEILYVLIPPGDYTDVDLQNFIGDTIEDDDSVLNLELFDDRGAIDAFLLPEADRTAGDLALIDSHHLATLQNGNRIIFRGPYSDSGEIAIGS